MKLTDTGTVPVYTIAGASTARPLPEWLARKRKRSLKKDPEYANRVELLQDFEFEEASACVRVSENGEWVMSTGTYKPQIHTHYLPHLSLSYARHTNSLNETFILLSEDYSKSLHLQSDRFLEFHTPGGLHYTTRIPRYGRDLMYNRRTAEALVPAVGVNADGNGEVFRLNLEIGRFMKGYEVDIGGDESHALQGGVYAGSVNCAATAEDSHGLLAFGTSLGTVEFWDSRSRNRVSLLGPSRSTLDYEDEPTPGITALAFHSSGLSLATGNTNGIVHTYDLRSPIPLLRKDQGYNYPIQNLAYISSPHASNSFLLTADKKGLKIWDRESGDYWAGIEPAVSLNNVEWVPNSGMFLTANEGRQQHAFFIPQLGPAPKWCAFLDNLVEEMAEDANDPHAFTSAGAAGEVYDNFKFLDLKQLQELGLDHLIGPDSPFKAYMHGYFVPQRLYDEARLTANPDLAVQQRQKSIQAKIDKERESRIRGSKKVAVKVNRKYAETLAAREEANERRKAQRLLRKGDETAQQPDDESAAVQGAVEAATVPTPTEKPLVDARFAGLFENDDFEIDETSREFALHNPSSVPNAAAKTRGLTAVEEEALDDARSSKSGSGSDSDEADPESTIDPVQRQRQRRDHADDEEARHKGRIGSASYQKSGHQRQMHPPPAAKTKSGPTMRVSSSSTGKTPRRAQDVRGKTFGERAAGLPVRVRRGAGGGSGVELGEREITFAPAKSGGKKRGGMGGGGDDGANGRTVGRGRTPREEGRRSASGNVFRRM